MTTKPEVGFDLTSIESLDTTTIDIIHPLTGKPTGVRVEVASYESERVKAVQRKLANKSLKKQRRRLTAEESEENIMIMACAAVVSWTGYTKDGEPVKCTPEAVREVMQLGWFATQIDEAASDQTLFIKA